MEKSKANEQIYSTKAIAAYLLTAIFEDAEMSEQFRKGGFSEINKAIEQKYSRKILQNNSKAPQPEKEEEKTNVSRLQIQIKKNDFQMTPICGEVFLMKVDAELEGRNRQTKGKLVMTNYRILFFSEGKKMVDLPFGLIMTIKYLDKICKVNYELKYPHSWTFFLATTNFKYQYFKKICHMYYKSNDPRNLFAFQYALKLSPTQYHPKFDLKAEYSKRMFDTNKKEYHYFENSNYSLCPSYPSVMYVPNFQDIASIAAHRKNRRFPILAYSYFNPQTKVTVPIWISSAYEEAKQINKQKEKDFLSRLKCNLDLSVFVAEGKSSKAIEQSIMQKGIQITHLNLQNNEDLQTAQTALMEVFLQAKKPFIKQILNSKWYYYIANILENCQLIRNNILHENSTLIRCDNGWDKSLVLVALVQIILDSSFRTFKGFQHLVMRVFVGCGHPFASRLGERSEGELTSPVFLQFLDCVSQLIFQNPSHFEFNFKYLAKIANLMFTNIYGTFLTDSQRQYQEKRIAEETVSIWSDLITPITTNGFYDKKCGLLDVESNISSIRLWHEHFGNLVSRNRDHYQFNPISEDNEDYLNLNCQQITEENKVLKNLLKQKQAELDRLRHELASL